MKTHLLPGALAMTLVLGALASAQGIAKPAPDRDLISGPVIVPPPQTPPPTASWTQAPLHQPFVPPVVQQGSAEGYCTSTINSTGLAATMGCAGSLSVCQNNTCLAADGVPAGNLGLFFYGAQAARIPMADGYLCVSPYHPGLFRILPWVSAGSNLRAELQLDLDTLPQAGAITPGSTWCFQYWFRDPAAGGTGSNLSDGLRITFSQ